MDVWFSPFYRLWLGWQGRSLVLLKYLKRPSASSLLYPQFFKSQLFPSIQGCFHPKIAGQYREDTIAISSVDGQHFTLQTCSSSGELPLHPKARRGGKMAYRTAFCQILQVSVIGLLLATIIIPSICIAFSSHRS